MRNNKILNAAIMAALAGAGASPFASADLNECGTTIATGTASTVGSCVVGLAAPPPNQTVSPIWGGSKPTLSVKFDNNGRAVATELVGTGWLAGTTAAGKNLTSVYCLGGTTSGTIGDDFYVTYTLTGAKFALTSDTTTSISTKNTVPGGIQATDFRGDGVGSIFGNSNTSVSFADVSSDQSTVKFLVQGQTSKSIKENSTLYFSFDIKSLDTLQTSGGSVTLATSFTKTNGASMTVAPECTKTLILSSKAIGDTGAISPMAKDGTDSPVYIDVETANYRFTSDRLGKDHSKADTTVTPNTLEGCFAVLGRLNLSGTGSAYMSDLSTPASTASVGNLVSNATFTVTNAPLNATGSTICLDLNGDLKCTLCPDTGTSTDVACAAAATKDIPEKVSGKPVIGADGTSATVTITDTTQAKSLLTSGPINILVGVDCANTTALKQLDGPATGTLILNYTDLVAGGNKNLKYTGTLKEIKRNGSECTLYNVPAPSAMENLNVRITNKSGKDVTGLWGILVSKDGSKVFGDAQTPVDLLPYTANKTFKNNETVYFSSDTLLKIAEANGFKDKWDRGVLRVISSAKKMELYGLLRSQGGENAPLQNMSVGASGNGCD